MIPRFDGLYRHFWRDSASWLRFTEAGVVLFASSVAPAGQVAMWLRPNSSSPIDRGTFVRAEPVPFELAKAGRGSLAADGRVTLGGGSVPYTFVPVTPRFLDGEGGRFKRVAWTVLGERAAALRKKTKLTALALNVLEADELVAAGLDGESVAVLLGIRGPHER